jgi:hypothetical protein
VKRGDPIEVRHPSSRGQADGSLRREGLNELTSLFTCVLRVGCRRASATVQIFFFVDVPSEERHDVRFKV